MGKHRGGIYRKRGNTQRWLKTYHKKSGRRKSIRKKLQKNWRNR